MSSQEYFWTIFGLLHGHQLVIYISGNPLEEVPFYFQQLDIDKYFNSQSLLVVDTSGIHPHFFLSLWHKITFFEQSKKNHKFIPKPLSEQ